MVGFSRGSEGMHGFYLDLGGQQVPPEAGSSLLREAGRASGIFRIPVGHAGFHDLGYLGRRCSSIDGRGRCRALAMLADLRFHPDSRPPAGSPHDPGKIV